MVNYLMIDQLFILSEKMDKISEVIFLKVKWGSLITLMFTIKVILQYKDKGDINYL